MSESDSSPNEGLEPAAYRWEQYIHHKTNSTTRLTPMSPEEFCEEYEGERQDIEKVADSEEPLFAAEDIIQMFESSIEASKDLQSKYKEGSEIWRRFQKAIDEKEALKRKIEESS